MWWLSKGGAVSGPFSDADIEKRIGALMIGALDKISEDKQKWQYVRDSKFWKKASAPQIQKNISGPLNGAHPRSLSTSAAAGSEAPAAGPQLVATFGGGQSQSRQSPVVMTLKQNGAASAKKKKTALIWSIAGAAVCILAAVLFFAIPSGGNYTTQPETAVAFVECDGEKLLGFLAEINGKSYLVSTEKALRGSELPDVRFSDGTLVDLGNFYVAHDRNLAMFEVVTQKQLLKLADNKPNAGMNVVIYGTRDAEDKGADLITKYKGQISSVDPELFEIEAGKVLGFTGGPVVDELGNVVGVFSAFRKDGRLFATPFKNGNWLAVDRDDYEKQYDQYCKVVRFYRFLEPLTDVIVRDVKVEYRKDELNRLRRFDVDDNKNLFSENDQDGMSAALGDVASAIKAFLYSEKGTIDCNEKKLVMWSRIESALRLGKNCAALYDGTTTVPQIKSDLLDLIKSFNEDISGIRKLIDSAKK